MTMSKDEIRQARDLLGPAPLLTSEDKEHFETFFIELAICLKPRDVLELMLIWHFGVEAWFINRYSRHAAVAIERRYQDGLRQQAQRTKVELMRRPKAEATGNSTPADIAALVALEDRIDSLDTDVDAILRRKGSERDHNRALERSIVFQEQLDRLITSASRRRDNALVQLEIYRAGWGEEAKEITDQVIEGEARDITAMSSVAPPLVPSDEETVNGPASTKTETGAQ